MKHILSGLVFLFLLLGSCHDYEKSRWEEYQGAGLPEDGVSMTTLRFLDTSVGFMGGRKFIHTFTPSGDLLSEKDLTVIYKTIDRGRTWEKLNVEFEGGITNIKFSGDSILALNQFLNTPPAILLSTDNGRNWREIAAFPKQSYVRGFGFYKGNSLLVALDDKKFLNLLKISNTVDTLKKFSRFHYKVVIGSENMFLVNPSSDANSDGVIKYNLISKSEEMFRFGANYYVQSIALQGLDQLYVAAQDPEGDGKVVTLKNGAFSQLELGEYSKYSLGQLFIAGGKIMLDANRKEAVGPTGVTHELLVSNDGGKSWEAENYPFPLIVAPADILDNGEFISYQGMGQFQKRK